MIVRRDQSNDDPNQQIRVIGTTTAPGSSLVAFARRDGNLAPVSPCDFVAGAMQSIARILGVIFRNRQTSLLTMT
jgi:hypothetical protein